MSSSGYTYSGHPRRVPRAHTLDIYKNEGLFERGRAVAVLSRCDVRAGDVPVVADIRGYGMFATIDVHADGRSSAGRSSREAVRERPQSQDDRRFHDHRAAAHRREEARRRIADILRRTLKAL
jgi:adenosylmethionine-8-amino-7-oxononanoate aminotransferase